MNQTLSRTQVSGQFALRSSAFGRSPADLPSEWHNGVSRHDADFIVENYTPVEIKALYKDRFPSGYISLSDIHRVIQAYQLDEDCQSKIKVAVELEKERQNEIKLSTKKAANEQTSR